MPTPKPADNGKPSHAFRCLIAEGATRDEVQTHLQRRIDKAKADYKSLISDMVVVNGLEAAIAEARGWLVEDAAAGLPQEWIAAFGNYLDRLEAKGATP